MAAAAAAAATAAVAVLVATVTSTSIVVHAVPTTVRRGPEQGRKAAVVIVVDVAAVAVVRGVGGCVRACGGVVLIIEVVRIWPRGHKGCRASFVLVLLSVLCSSSVARRRWCPALVTFLVQPLVVPFL